VWVVKSADLGDGRFFRLTGKAELILHVTRSRWLWVAPSRFWSDWLESGHCAARNGGGMASPRLSSLLDLEKPSAGRSTKHQSGGARDNSKDEPGQPTLGRMRIHGELLKLGLHDPKVRSRSTKYKEHNPRPPWQSWRTFLENHILQRFVFVAGPYRHRHCGNYRAAPTSCRLLNYYHRTAA